MPHPSPSPTTTTTLPSALAALDELLAAVQKLLTALAPTPPCRDSDPARPSHTYCLDADLDV